MEERNLKITRKQAIEWYNSNNSTLKELALSAFTENELNSISLSKIEEQVGILATIRIPYNCISYLEVYHQLLTIASYYNKNWERTLDNVGYFLAMKFTCYEDKVNKTGSIYIAKHISVQYPGIVYFKDEFSAKKAVELIGMDRLKEILR